MSGSIDMNNRPMLWLLFGTDGAITAQSGVCGASVVRNSVGNYTVTLSGNVLPDTAFCSLKAQVRGGAVNANVQVTWSSDTSLTVLTAVGTVATDEIVDLEIVNKRAAAG